MNVTLPALSSLAKIAFFCAFVASGLIVATNPDYLLPATPECVALASLLLWATGSGILGVRHIPQKDRWLLGGILFSVTRNVLRLAAPFSGLSASYSLQYCCPTD